MILCRIEAMDDELRAEITHAMNFHYLYGFYPALSIDAWLYLRGSDE